MISDASDATSHPRATRYRVATAAATRAVRVSTAPSGRSTSPTPTALMNSSVSSSERGTSWKTLG
ncbi:Uncharacterised protein [Mycobacteroides abscessus subsp. abscessus]|nr:Uncharacterised protein [Mycobacteroides abscessus subsp. abscessus]